MKFYHGTCAECAESIFENGFVHKETVFNNSDPDRIYLVRKDFPGQDELESLGLLPESAGQPIWESCGFRSAVTSGQTAAAKFASNEDYVMVFEFDCPESVLKLDCFCREDTFFYSIKSEQLTNLVKNKLIKMTPHRVKHSYNKYLAPVFLARLPQSLIDCSAEMKNAVDILIEGEKQNGFNTIPDLFALYQPEKEDVTNICIDFCWGDTYF